MNKSDLIGRMASDAGITKAQAEQVYYDIKERVDEDALIGQ
jgi:nucleoid DNA-binding protein